MPTDKTDAVVVGAGVIGSSIAYELAARGYEVLVIDKSGGPGYGSTSASSAVIRFNYSTFDGMAAAWESLHCWQNWSEHLNATVDGALAKFRQCGMALLDVDVAPHARTIGLFEKIGIDYQLWDATTLVEKIPGIDAGKYYPPKPVDSESFFADAETTLGALYTPQAGFVDDPQLAAANLAAAARSHGAVFAYNTRVVTVEQLPDGIWQLGLDDGESVKSKIVVNAAGPWSGAFNKLSNVGADFKVSVRPLRQEVHHVTAPTGYNDDEILGPMIADLDLGTYMRAEPGNGFLVGGTEPDCDPLEWIDDPDTANPNRTVARFEAQVFRAARRFPTLEVPSQPKGIAGVYDAASDWTPIYDKTDRQGFYVAIGTSGNQFKNAPIAGRLMSRIIDQVEAGHDHDADPLTYVGMHTGLEIDLGAFSRLRAPNAESTGTVMG
ncbi:MULTISPECIES: NAD(P)/FAD-dependent oxidoreductase [Rhodococcus]|uniref:FAD-binding oxidoreductase n=1 Tax=Rhodococcus qingshengii JCM 15477 TaxID=1303681 RepID=A0AB38RER6_RHOSG|nr:MULTISPECIES: FAD-dependent oxidoreductase [Rhodococcus]QXC43798.1 FAD-binding oxidoreductase [Rhodococcus qingshengii]UPU43892.1 FAD-binding oxidoreductase [Rhodococcus qingshengii JCM 15477]BCF81229.1 FAD-dependent oxidoreductase [Rhodococcus qingshengii]